MKKTNFLRVLALIMALCLASVLFVGCKDEDTPEAQETTAAQSAESTEAPSSSGDTSTEAQATEAKQSEKGYIKLVLSTNEDEAYIIDLDNVTGKDGVLSLLDYMKNENMLTYDCDASGFLTRVGDVAQDAAAGKYIYIYTSVTKDQDVSAYASTVTYKDMTLVSTGVGAKDMTLEADAVIYVGTIVWN